MALDLVRQLPAAAVERETRVIDFGTAAARAHLASGWGHDERDSGETVVWGLGESSELVFYASGAVDVTLVLTGRKLDFEGAGRQTVTVALNGHHLGKLTVGRRLGRHRLVAPAATLRQGNNRLHLTYSQRNRPAEVLPGASDERPLAVQWHSLELRGLASAGPPRPAASSGGGDPVATRSPQTDLLELPLGTEVSYYFDAEPGQELVIGGIDSWNRRNVQLAVVLETDGGRSSQRVDPRAARPPVRIPLDVESKSLARLALIATRAASGGGWPGSRGAGLSLLLPVVTSRHRSDAETTASAKADPAPAALPSSTPAPGSPAPDVLIYVIDTLRADRLGVYGYGRPTSPRIDRFAGDAVVFTDAQAQSSWTRSSMVSLFTGLLPQVHGVNRRDDGLSRSLETLAEIFQGAGYETAGMVTNGNLAASFGLGQGFDDYRYLNESRRERTFHQLSDQLNESALPWLEERAAAAERRPFLLYLHATDPHAPYTPPEPYRRRFAAGVDPEIGLIDIVHDISARRKPAPEGIGAAWSDLYDGEVAFNDHHFGELIDKLRSLGLYDSMAVLLTSDHGEEFGEHGGWEHGKTLYAEQLRIPMILKLPGGRSAGARLDGLVGHVDVLPTLLELLDLEAPAALDGRSVLPLLRGEDRRRPSYAYLRLEQYHVRSVIARDFKLILDDSAYLRGAPVELYQVAEDPTETVELAARNPLELGFLRQTLRAFELDLSSGRRQSVPEQAEISDELRQRLEALGYLGH